MVCLDLECASSSWMSKGNGLVSFGNSGFLGGGVIGIP